MGEPATIDPQDASRTRRRRRSGRSRSRTRGRLRLVYFGLASVWGMLAGTVAVAVALALIGRPVEPHPTLIGGLAAAVLLAVAGGLVAANAYGQAARR